MEERLPNIHPGEVLAEEFLQPLNIPADRLARAIQVSPARICEIVRGKRRMTPNLALRLGKFFGTSAQFWLGLQMDYDLEDAQQQLGRRLERIPSLHESQSVNV